MGDTWRKDVTGSVDSKAKARTWCVLSMCLVHARNHRVSLEWSGQCQASQATRRLRPFTLSWEPLEV